MTNVTIPAPPVSQWCPFLPHSNDLQIIADHKRDIQTYNDAVQANWNYRCLAWSQQATYNRDYNVPPNPPTKPVWTTPQYEVVVVYVISYVPPSTDPEVKTIVVTTPDRLRDATGFYMYDQELPPQTCPDLPAPK